MKARIIAKKSGKLINKKETVLQGEILELSALLEGNKEGDSYEWLVKRSIPMVGKRPLKINGKHTEINLALLEPRKYDILLKIKSKDKVYTDKIKINLLENQEVDKILKEFI